MNQTKSKERNTGIKLCCRSKDLTDIYKTFHWSTTECTFLSTTRGAFCKIDHIVGHKSSLNKSFFKKKIIPCILSDHNSISPQINNKRNYRKYTNACRLKHTIK